MEENIKKEPDTSIKPEQNPITKVVEKPEAPSRLLRIITEELLTKAMNIFQK